MLRRARWLILLAIVAIAGTVGSVFYARKEALLRHRPHASTPLPDNTSATAQKWEYEIKAGDRAKLVIRARHFEQIKEPAVYVFEDLEMEIREVKGGKYDLVKSKHATLDQEAGSMYSDGDVEITMNLSQNPEQPAGRLLKIQTSGVTLDVKTSRASTDRKATFEFDQGSGECEGAVYDPSTHELLMKTQAKIDWRGKDAQKPPMRVEASQVVYKELEKLVQLSAPSKLTRGTFTLNAAESLVHLDNEGMLDHVEAKSASGTDVQPGKELAYAADNLILYLTPKGEVKKIEAMENARLDSKTATALTHVTASRFDLDFEAGDEGSVLKRALATGKGRVESEPVARQGTPPQGKRILTSEVIDLEMRAGGKEIDKVSTHTPGQVEFLPGKKGDRKRLMTGERLYIQYGADNMIKTCRSVNVTTRTESEGKGGKPVIMLTKSKDLQADFDEKTGQMARLEQWTDFEYEEGTRRATAGHASLDAATDLIKLKTKARMWDETGSTAADEITLEQQTGDMVAVGNVSSMRQPEKKQVNEGLLSSSQPLNARAARMSSTEKNQKIKYEGDALLWQADSRLQAKTINIDRSQQTLEATGDVVSQLPDQRGDAQAQNSQKSGKKSGNSFTIVKAPSLVYSDKTQLATYVGGVTLDRPGMNVKSSQLRAWFEKEPKKGGGDETRLDRMFADGAVEIKEVAPDRTRNGNGEHAEYYVDDERIILNGGNPVVVDSKRGTSRGAEITWYSRQDKLVVDNSGSGPAVSRINQGKKK